MRTISEQELKDILDKHSKWLDNQEGGERADLSGADLSGANLSDANLRNANLRYADLSYADLSDANLSGANLSYANLHYADLSNANLSYADLSYANLSYADLSYANLSYADLSYADLSYANLIQFQCQRHQAFYTFDGTLRIGCHVMPITEWALGFEEIGKKEGYNDLQILAYGGFIKTCLAHFEQNTKEKNR